MGIAHPTVNFIFVSISYANGCITRYFLKRLESKQTKLSYLDLKAFSNFDCELLRFIFKKSEIQNDLVCDRIQEILRQKIIDNDFEDRLTCGFAMKYLALLEDDWAITKLKNDYDREDYFSLYKWGIIDVFSQVKDSSTIPCLIYALFEGDRTCISHAAKALEKREDIIDDFKIDILTHSLCQAIHDEETRYITNMVIGEALNKISPQQAVKKLSLMLECDNLNIRINALQALRYRTHLVSL